MADKKQPVGSAWKRTTKNGNSLISIKIGDQRYSMWENRFKKSDKDADYRIFVDDWVPQGQAHPKTDDDVTGGDPF